MKTQKKLKAVTAKTMSLVMVDWAAQLEYLCSCITDHGHWFKIPSNMSFAIDAKSLSSMIPCGRANVCLTRHLTEEVEFLKTLIFNF